MQANLPLPASRQRVTFFIRAHQGPHVDDHTVITANTQDQPVFLLLP
jgi:hypothetical protein